MLQGEHPAILSTFIKLPFANRTFVLTIFELPFYKVLQYHNIANGIKLGSNSKRLISMLPIVQKLLLRTLSGVNLIIQQYG